MASPHALNPFGIRLKAQTSLTNEFITQLLTYLKLRGGGIGLLINFNVYLLKEGICRLRV